MTEVVVDLNGPADPFDLTALHPAMLRDLDGPALARLAERIRSFLIESVSATGGHLGSNLGVVELTIALHRVFDSPSDRIVWDTGHQTYVHKIVTGRAAAFSGLRRAGGLSGYANRAESAHDLVENSHASTALSYACGLARARALHHEDHHVVAVLGDGALTGGLAYEALSNIASSGARVIIVLNDNGRSYAPTNSPLTTAAGVGIPGASPAEFFAGLGLRYMGPIDGHDLAALDRALRHTTTASGPIVLHVHTEKGRGYGPAERDDVKRLHDVPPFDPATGRPCGPAAGRTYTDVFAVALAQAGERHRDLVAVTAAMPGSCGLLEFARRYPDRFVDVGIAEQHAVSMAAGMAMDGLRPVVAVYSTFLNRAWDQVYYDVGLHRLPVIFCIDRAGLTGDDGPSHNGVMDVALLTKVPGMTVFAPSNAEELAVMFSEALSMTAGPVALRWPKSEAVHGPTGTGLTAQRLRRGNDVCLLGLGKMVACCEEAADELERDGVSTTVWDIRVARPLDRAMIRDARRHRVVLTAEDGVVEGGVGSSLERAMRELPDTTPPPALAICGLPLEYFPQGPAADLLIEHGLSGPGLANRVRNSLASRRPLGRRPVAVRHGRAD